MHARATRPPFPTRRSSYLEFFAGSIRGGFERVMHLRKAALPGGDAAARDPVQCAAGFLVQIEGLPCFDFPVRYKRSEEHTSELQSQSNLVCRLLLEKKR